MNRQNQDLDSDLIRFSAWVHAQPITNLRWLKCYRELFAGLLKTVLYQGGYHQWGVMKSVALEYEKKVFSVLNWLNSISNIDFSCDQGEWDVFINWISIKEFLQEIGYNIIFRFDASIWFRASVLQLYIDWVKYFKQITLNPSLIKNKTDRYVFALFHEIGHIVDSYQKPINTEEEIYILQKEIENKGDLYKSSKWVDSSYREYLSESKKWMYDNLMREHSRSEVNANTLWLQLFKVFCDKYNINDLGIFFEKWEHILNMFLNTYIPIDPYFCNENWLFLLKRKEYQDALRK